MISLSYSDRRGSGKCCGIFFRPCLLKAFVFLVVSILVAELAEAQPSLLPKPKSVYPALTVVSITDETGLPGSAFLTEYIPIK